MGLDSSFCMKMSPRSGKRTALNGRYPGLSALGGYGAKFFIRLKIASCSGNCIVLKGRHPGLSVVTLIRYKARFLYSYENVVVNMHITRLLRISLPSMNK